MQIQRINCQNYSAKNRQLKASTDPSFGIIFAKTPAFEKSVVDFRIKNVVDKVLKNANKIYKNLDQTFVLDKGIVKTDFGDVFGTSSEYVASRLPEDVAEGIARLATKTRFIKSLSKHIDNLNEVNKISIQFEKNTIESADDSILHNFFPEASSYLNIKNKINDVANSLSALQDKDKYVLKLGFDKWAPGLVKAKLVDAKDESIVSHFVLGTDKNSQRIKKAIEDINQQQLLK